MNSIPIWFQVLIGIVGILGFLGGAAAFFFVLWPSIRRQNRLGEKLEVWLEGDEAKKLFAWLRSKLTIGGERASREEFAAQEEKEDGTL